MLDFHCLVFDESRREMAYVSWDCHQDLTPSVDWRQLKGNWLQNTKTKFVRLCQ